MHNDCCLNALIAPRVLKSIIWCDGIQAKWRPLSFTTPSTAAVALSPHFPSRPSEKQRPVVVLSVVLSLNHNSPPDTEQHRRYLPLELFLQLASTVREGTFSRGFLLCSSPHVLRGWGGTFITAPLPRLQERNVRPLLRVCRRHSSHACSISVAPGGRNSANKPFRPPHHHHHQLPASRRRGI